MSLHLKVALIMAVAVLLMTVLNVVVLVPVSRSFAELEHVEARRNSDRIPCSMSAWQSRQSWTLKRLPTFRSDLRSRASWLDPAVSADPALLAPAFATAASDGR